MPLLHARILSSSCYFMTSNFQHSGRRCTTTISFHTGSLERTLFRWSKDTMEKDTKGCIAAGVGWRSTEGRPHGPQRAWIEASAEGDAVSWNMARVGWSAPSEIHESEKASKTMAGLNATGSKHVSMWLQQWNWGRKEGQRDNRVSNDKWSICNAEKPSPLEVYWHHEQ